MAEPSIRRFRHVPLWLLVVAFACGSAHARKKAPKRELSEDSLQTLVTQQPENSENWLELGTLAAKKNQVDLAKGYFDEGIKLSGRSGAVILQVGGIWLSLGKVKLSLPYLMPNLALLDSSQLDRLQGELEKEKMYTAQLIALRHLGSRSKDFQPINHKLAILAFKLGDFTLCQSVLARFPDQLDYESARNLLTVNFFQSGTLDNKVLASLQKRFSQAEMVMLEALNYAAAGQWRDARRFIAQEANGPSYRDYYNLLRGMEASADDRHAEAAAYYQKALDAATWDKLKAITYAELYRLYSTTGNKFKSDQLWDSIKEEYASADPDLLEFMGRQLMMRSYEKQAKYFYRMVLRKRPGNVTALAALYDDMVGNEDYQILTDNLKAALDRDPLSCEANTLAMNYQFQQKNDKDMVPYARNATIYCYESREPYFLLGNAFLNMSKPDEARAYFSTYVRKGGDISKVPVSLR
jgi:tetratricopeptide (TPR) repeat protein